MPPPPTFRAAKRFHPRSLAPGMASKTIPGKGWFVYFRIYGPGQPAFDGSWQLPDFQPG